MKISSFYLNLLGCVAGLALSLSVENANGAPNTAHTAPFTVTERGPNHRVWQQVTIQTNSVGKIVYRTNSYIELATGMHYWNGGQWADSSDQIQLTQTGAAATNGQHQVNFAANLNSAVAVDLATPDGKHLQSHVLGLAYFDSITGKSVLFAEAQDSIGQLLQSGNEVIYTNAFTDVQADVRYRYKKNGFEQDIILRQQPPSPANYGMNPSSTRLQIWTEFVNPPEPTVTSNMVSAPMAGGPNQGRAYLADSKLDFGIMKIRRGNASSLGGNTNVGVLAPIAKQWVHIDGRTFLIEEVYLKSVEPQLQALPPAPSTNANGTGGTGGTGGQGASLHLKLPPLKQQARSTQRMRLAQMDTGRELGLLLDYQTVNGSLTNYIFQGDTTYYVSGETDFYDTTTIEGGAIIKCGEVGGDLIVIDNLQCQTASYRPAILTCTNDDSVGQILSGSSGIPGFTLTTYLVSDGGGTISNLFFRYAFNAYSGYAADVEVWDCQFIDCNNAITVNSDTTTLGVHNVLITMDDSINNSSDFYGLYPGAFVIYSPALNVYGENITADLGSQNLIMYFSYSSYYTNGTSFAFTNSILVTPNLNPRYQYGSPPAMTVSTNTTFYASSLPADLFTNVGAASHYSPTNSTYQMSGNPNISSGLLADLSNKTIYPPIVLSNITISANTNLIPQPGLRDTSSAPYLGYHYDPLDYAVDDLTVDGATLTLTNGVAVGMFGYQSITVNSNAQLVSQGTPTNLNHIVRYNTVQDLSTNWVANTNELEYSDISFFETAGGTFYFRFTDMSFLANAPYCKVLITGNPTPTSLVLQDSRVSVADFVFLQENSATNMPSLQFRNNLLERTYWDVEEQASEGGSGGSGFLMNLNNNLLRGGSMYFSHIYFVSNGQWNIRNNLFDKPAITDGIEYIYNGGYNGYITNYSTLAAYSWQNVVLTNSPAYQSSWLGAYYLPPNSPLTNSGSTTANLLGLYQYTTQTNQVKQADSQVDIGFHYVAVDSNGNPIDTNGDGTPDYLEDANGNGLWDYGETDWMVMLTDPNNIGPTGLEVFTPLHY